MKYMIVKGGSLAVITCLVFACSTKKEQPSVVIDTEKIKKEIQAKENEFAELYNKGELRSVGYFADDAISFFQNRPPLVGKQAIVNFLKEDIASNTNRIQFKTNEVFVSSDANQVVEVGAYTVVDSTDTPLNSGNYITLFEKRNGKYVALRDMSASSRPLPEN